MQLDMLRFGELPRLLIGESEQGKIRSTQKQPVIARQDAKSVTKIEMLH